MPSIADITDRLSYIANDIHTTAQKTGKIRPGPFVTAFFNRDIQAVIRDIDDYELGLFTIENGVTASQVVEEDIGRKKFTGATPLRKRPGKQPVTEDYEPEIYAESALKYLDR